VLLKRKTNATSMTTQGNNDAQLQWESNQDLRRLSIIGPALYQLS